MNILQYEALVKTLEYGTLSRAAEEMGYTQSGLSRM
ncbi:MAG: LysR family transcriptional regulator, partial [Oribacterium sp.]|nr:LysR family transcriptional regulator [Oribacterium sp.]